MDFGRALIALQEGKKVQRHGWNGKGMWLILIPGSTVKVEAGRPFGAGFPAEAVVTYHPHIDMKAVDGTVFCWNPNQLDMLAEDWEVLRSPTIS